MKQSPIPYVLGVLQNPASEDIDFDADQVYDMIICKLSHSALWSAVIGHCYNALDIS